MDECLAPVHHHAECRPSEASRYNEVWLLGQPPLDSYLDYIAKALSGPDLLKAQVVDEWRQANDYYYELETREAGSADRIETLSLPPALARLAEDVSELPGFARGFDILPTRFALVELEQLVVSQRQLDLIHIRRLRERLPAEPSSEEVFRFCFPLHRTQPSVEIRQIASNRYTLWSESSDFRFQEAVVLRAEQLVGHQVKGEVGAVIGILVGFGSNFLCAVQFGGRVLLRNGYHRAYALLEHGVTHAPCIIETVTRRDELDLVVGKRVQDAPAFYFKAPRPPLLKDFLDPRIRKVIQIPRVRHAIDVEFQIRDYQIAL
jgi:hypothetical protein